MDSALPELGSGAEPDDRPVWGEAHPVPVKNNGQHASRTALMLKKAGTSHFTKNVPAIPYPIGISSIARNIQPYSGGRVWAESTDSFLLLMPDQHAKNSKIMYITKNNGNTIIRKEIRQHKNNAI